MTTLSGLWVGRELPKSALLCIKSHLDHGFGFRLFVYPHLFSDLSSVPNGCEVVDANSVIYKEAIYKLKLFNSYAAFVDWWRYTFQYWVGAPIIDLDMICLRPWKLEHYAYYIPNKRQVIAGWLNFPKGTQLMLDLCNSFCFPNCIEKQADWIKKHHADKYNGDSTITVKEQLSRKRYGWCASDWLINGVKHYNLDEHIGVMRWYNLFPAGQYRQLFDGTVKPDDPRLDELNELHLHGHRIFSYGNTGIFAKYAADSVFGHLWNKHFG